MQEGAMSRGKSTASEDLDWLKRVVNSIECLVRQEKNDGVPPWARQIPHEDAERLIKGAKCYFSGKAKTLEGALKLKRRGRPVNSYKPENLELAKKARRLKKQGMICEDVTQELFKDRRDPPSARYVQILIKRFTPAIEEEERKAFVDELRQRQLVRSLTPPRLAPRRGIIRIEAIWVDPNRQLTTQDLRMLRRQARKRRDPE
jgi:hypothetical protein